MELFNSLRFRRFLKQTFLLAVLFAVVVFTWVRTLLFELPFSFREDGMVLLKTITVSWIIMIAFRGGWHLLLLIGEQARQRQMAFAIRKRTGGIWLIIIGMAVIIASCNVRASGFHTDAKTGLTTSYTGITAMRTRIVMNGETLNHTDIPLGEKFIIINEGIKGLTVKGDKVSVGCSLLITDTTGKQMLFEKDLFEKNGLFDRDKITYLQCQVNTGVPMDWMNEYNVKVTFWDKFGEGSIENEVNVNMIDEP